MGFWASGALPPPGEAHALVLRERPGLQGRWEGRGHRPGTCVGPQVISDSLHPIFLGFRGGGGWGEEAGSRAALWTSRPLSEPAYGHAADAVSNSLVAP